jgi:hypothetical protein
VIRSILRLLISRVSRLRTVRRSGVRKTGYAWNTFGVTSLNVFDSVN